MNQHLQDGHLSDLALSQYVDGLLKDQVDKVSSPILDHIDDCSHCHADALELFAISKANISAVPASAKSNTGGNYMWIFYTLFVLGISSAFWVFSQQFQEEEPAPLMESPISPPSKKIAPKETPTKEEKTKITPKKIIPKKDNEIQKTAPVKEQTEPESKVDDRVIYAAAFVPNEELEDFRTDRFRDELSFTVSSPKDNYSSAKGKTIDFSFQTDAEAPFQIIILDNQQKKIQQIKLLSPSLSWMPPATMTPGLYYWKVETEEDLLFVGRFQIQN